MSLWDIIENNQTVKTVSGQPKITTERLRVPSGWVVRTIVVDQISNSPVSSSMVFVPDPSGHWEVPKN